MGKLLVFGHQNPDTDAIASAISFAYLQNQLGVEAEAVALGTPNEETQYALNYFKKDAPRVVETVANETDQVALMDHCEAQQSVSDIQDVEVKFVVDHHRIANFQTANPLYYRAEPVGCTNTIIYKLYKENDVEIPASIAGLMVSAIISDTLLFKSPTCTKQDIVVATELSTIAGIDLNTYGLDMLKAGTNLSNKSEEVLIDLDAKSFTMGGKNLRIAQVNTVDVPELLERRAALVAAMSASNAANNYDIFVLVITDILTSESTILPVGTDLDTVAEAFNASYQDGLLVLPGVVSRKKQVVPPLTNAFEG
ncbi:manganese-dependent inorganic pyrophosphatase [Granulicatella balaenopterae]|uniref:Probable manganese-dependent inorganic pyrophosphatase n=1 Tax=Granulicatella balaenopterae TaxID=137733 RepID=A0A1H9NPG2_9LACT|nr:manganese-dependent inorganic pyrophosphatase [Granulicatella balaenopterae]SER37637.1 manganese-dependent inorganic pyrophosphatase [Granulicatella balaenopterae]